MLSVTVCDLRGYIAVVKLKGRLVLGEIAGFREKMRTAIQVYDRIIIDLGEVTMIDPAGLGALLASYSMARAVGAYIALTNMANHRYHLMVIAKLIAVFPIIDGQVFVKKHRKRGEELSEEGRLRAGETVGIKMLPHGGWSLGEVLEVCGTRILLNSNRPLFRDAPVKLSWADNVILGVVESCTAIHPEGYRAVVEGYQTVNGRATITGLDEAA